MNIITYISAFKKLKENLERQKQFNKSFLTPYVQELEKKYNGKFHTGQIEKIEKYYGLFIPAVLAASFKQLYNEYFSDEERRRVTMFGILTPVGDDLFDIDKLDIESIRTLTYTPEKSSETCFAALVSKEIQSYLLATVPEREAYIHASKNVFEIQIETSKQTDRSISDEELEEITFKKGGYSVIIYHETLKKASPQIWDALFYIGSLMQLANDIFDMHKDVPDGIITLPNRCRNFKELRRKYMERVRECNRKIYALPFNKKNKQEFCIIMNFIISRGVVALDKFIQMENLKTSPLNMAQLSRKEIICDMQKPLNLLRWLKYIYLLPTLK